MFGWVATGAVAALLLASPAAPGGETDGALVMDAPAVIALSAHTGADAPASIESADGTQDVVLAEAPAAGRAGWRLAALDPIEPLPQAPALTAPPAAPSPAIAEPFGLTTMPVAAGGVVSKWTGVEANIRADQEILARCRAGNACPAAAKNFLAIIAAGQARTGRARIGVINRAVNLAIRPESDLAQWGVIDRWSAPLETFTTGRGDCEDYAIAKYVALTQAGVPAADVRLVIVSNLAANEDHAVVTVRLNGAWIVLDNRWLILVDASVMPQVTPLFVLDQTGVRQFAPAMSPVASRARAPYFDSAS